MAEELQGGAELLRIYEYLDANPASIRNLYLLMDVEGAPRAVRVSIPMLENEMDFVTEAPEDGVKYTRKDGLWENMLSGVENVFAGQAHAASSLESWSASKTFDADNGNSFEMDVTATTTVSIDNAKPGTYNFRFKIDNVTPPTITFGAKFGTKLTNSGDIDNTDGVVNIITLVVWASDNDGATITRNYTITQ